VLASGAFLGALWLEQSLAGRAEVAENVRYVREVAIGDATEQPFRNLNLTGALLGGLDLSCTGYDDDEFCQERLADFQSAELEGADLSLTNASGGSFVTVNARSADFSGADLRRAVFLQADLREASFYAAVLQDANFDDADLRGADLRGAQLTGASFVGADLRGAFLPSPIGHALTAEIELERIGDADFGDALLDDDALMWLCTTAAQGLSCPSGG